MGKCPPCEPGYTIIIPIEQLASMVQSKATTRAALEKVAGVGDVPIDKPGFAR